MKARKHSNVSWGMLWLLALSAASPVSHASARPPSRVSQLDRQSFLTPPKSVRPLYRWWLPLAAVDPVELRRELDEMARAGAGGVEVAAMPVPGDIGRDTAFLKERGFGSKAWTDTLETIFTYARHLGMRVDVMVGPHWPTSMPTVSNLDNPAAQQKLVAGYARIAPGAVFADAPPSPDEKVEPGAPRTLVAVQAVRCASADCPATGSVRLLDPAAVVDLTANVDARGKLNWTAPAGPAAWWIIAYYQTADGQKVEHLSASSPNYVIDHIGPAGAQAVTDYYGKTILNPRLRALIRRRPGSSLFEDSFEPSVGLKWTSTFLAEFAVRRGYDLKSYLAMLVRGDVGARKGFFDFADIGERVREDYRQTFSDLYGANHIAPYNRFAHGLGMTTRLQVEGGPMEIADLAALPDIPEGENRNFLNNPELWKVIGTGAQLRTVEALLSTECCPIDGGTWATTAGGKPFTIAQGTGGSFGRSGNNANLNWVYKAYAGGVNQLVWHGFPYLTTPPGSGPRAKWPGNSFDGNTQFSEAFGPRMPQWPDYRLVNDHLARLQLMLRQGRARYDVAVFWHDFGVKGIAPDVTAFTGYPGLSKMPTTTAPLARAGFTYQYVSPSYLTAQAAGVVRDGVWMPDGPGFRAILLNEQTVMPVESLARIRDTVLRHGVPLVVIGGLPRRTPGLSGLRGGDAELARIVAELKAQAARPGSCIRFVAGEAQATRALAELGVTPAASPVVADDANDILTVRRHSADADYYLLFNQGTRPISTTLALAGAGTPAELDSWTGVLRPLALYEGNGAQVRIPVAIPPNDVRLIAVGRVDGSEALHAVSADGGTVRREGKALMLRTEQPGRFETRLSNGSSVVTSVGGVTAPIPLDRWTLKIESWTPDQTNLPGLDHTLRRQLPELAVTADTDHALPGWDALGHADKAGLGFYTAEVALPATWTRRDGAWLDLGRVVDTFRIEVNGRAVPPSGFQDTSRIDIGPYLRGGSNRIVVRVATPLRNAVESATGEGAKRLTGTGLIGPVVLRPYRDIPLRPGVRAH